MTREIEDAQVEIGDAVRDVREILSRLFDRITMADDIESVRRCMADCEAYFGQYNGAGSPTTVEGIYEPIYSGLAKLHEALHRA